MVQIYHKTEYRIGLTLSLLGLALEILAAVVIANLNNCVALIPLTQNIAVCNTPLTTIYACETAGIVAMIIGIYFLSKAYRMTRVLAPGPKASNTPVPQI